MDHVERRSPGRFGIPAAAKGAWQSDYVFVAQVDEIGNNHRWRVALTFEAGRVAATLQDLTGFFLEAVTVGWVEQE